MNIRVVFAIIAGTHFRFVGGRRSKLHKPSRSLTLGNLMELGIPLCAVNAAKTSH
jgi:hypothetical protein